MTNRTNDNTIGSGPGVSADAANQNVGVKANRQVADAPPAVLLGYQEYILSARWKDSIARLAEFESAGYRCRVCNDPREVSGLEAHHRTYARFGHEDAGDLTALCRECHGVVTDHLRRRRYALRRPKRADFRAALENPTDLFDATAKGVRK